MSERVLSIEGKVTGAYELSRLFALAPQVYLRHLRKGLSKEGQMYIGGKWGRRQGVFRERLARKELWGGRVAVRGYRVWTPQMRAQFKGFLKNQEKIDQMSLNMGVFGSHKIHEILRFLEHGGTISAGGRQMIIPIYSNLRAFGVSPKTGKSGQALRNFSKERGIFMHRAGGTTRYYDKETVETTGDYRRALVFIGVKSVTIKKQYDFMAGWAKREPAAMRRLQKEVDKATADVQKGKTA